mmetsp:Transcript_20101/g.48336  ORF Transcript_20101/g.48336 Transcript_20101/m.48336 type:complete len:87 (-) Transcript_20101:25-285(-)
MVLRAGDGDAAVATTGGGGGRLGKTKRSSSAQKLQRGVSSGDVVGGKKKRKKGRPRKDSYGSGDRLSKGSGGGGEATAIHANASWV